MDASRTGVSLADMFGPFTLHSPRRVLPPFSACGALLVAGLVVACGTSAPPPVGGISLDAGADTGTDGGTEGGTDGGAWLDASVRVRIACANLSSGNNQAYEQPGIDILQGVAPDVVLIQEFNYPDGGTDGLVHTTFGDTYSYFAETNVQIPNGVISRYPIIKSGSMVDPQVSNRGFAWAHIDVPGPIDLWAFSLHLLTTSSTARAAETASLVTQITAMVPSTDYLVIGGDFNTDSTSTPEVENLAAVVVTAPPYPADNLGNTNTSGPRSKPHDWVLSNTPLTARMTPVQIGVNAFPNGLVFDSRVYTPLSDVVPVVVGDSAASGMQHMLVAKDFLLGGAN